MEHAPVPQSSTQTRRHQVRRAALIAALMLACAAPGLAIAQDSHTNPPLQIPKIGPAPEVAPEDTPEDDGFNLMEEGAKLLFKGLMSEMEPALDDMGKAVAELEPALKDLLAMVDDIRNYQAPEMLPNGDIIIRRKPSTAPTLPIPDPPATPLNPDGSIDL